VSLADFGIGTVVGTSITSAVAIFLDQRRRKDEKKRLFFEEKRLMYRNVAQAFDVMAEQVVLFGKFDPYFRRVEELDPEGQEIVERAYGLLKDILAKTKERYWDDQTDFALLASREAKQAATAALETMQQMLACIASDEPCDWTFMQVLLEEQLHNFRYFAREDLGIDA